MNRAILMAAAIALLAGPAMSWAADDWTEDFKAARKIAKKEGKPIIIDFTGSDW